MVLQHYTLIMKKLKIYNSKELIETVSSASKNLTMPGWEPEKLDEISE